VKLGKLVERVQDLVMNLPASEKKRFECIRCFHSRSGVEASSASGTRNAYRTGKVGEDGVVKDVVAEFARELEQGHV
jgi:hypothetical protein